jgi:hypothetical protein
LKRLEPLFHDPVQAQPPLALSKRAFQQILFALFLGDSSAALSFKPGSTVALPGTNRPTESPSLCKMAN